jgi:uncharacterized MAPEG superfamily protein
MSATASALAGFAGWFLLLTAILGFYRTALVLSGQRAANSFRSDGTDTPGFGQRLVRARDNVYENLPVFAALALAAHITGQLAITDPLAPVVLYARLGQSLTHLASVSVPAVFLRFGFYIVQIVVWAWWAIQLLG